MLIILSIVFVVGFIALQIWGLVSSIRTDHTRVKVGRLMLHLFLWGWFMAAIFYAIKADNNRVVSEIKSLNKE